MTDAAHSYESASPEITPEDLAAKLAARLCHDFMSPASGIVSGLDLLEDPSAKDMRDEAMALIASSARKLVDQLTFARVAFGSYASADVFDSRELENLAKGVFAHVRPDLQWDVPAGQLSKPAARALLNLVQIAAGALAVGGTARATVSQDDGRTVVTVEAVGPRAKLQDEISSGLGGRGPGEGLSGRWVQAYYLHALVAAAGGRVSAEASEEKVTFRAVLPA